MQQLGYQPSGYASWEGVEQHEFMETQAQVPGGFQEGSNMAAFMGGPVQEHYPGDQQQQSRRKVAPWEVTDGGTVPDPGLKIVHCLVLCLQIELMLVKLLWTALHSQEPCMNCW
jgi:hypothetical protein